MSKLKMGDTKKGPSKLQPVPEVRKETELEKYFKSLVSNKFEESTIKLTERHIRGIEKAVVRAIRKGEVAVR